MKSIKSENPEKDRVEVHSNSRGKFDSKNKFGNNQVSNNNVNNNEISKRKNYQIMSKCKKIIGSLNCFIFGAGLTLNKLKQVFV